MSNAFRTCLWRHRVATRRAVHLNIALWVYDQYKHQERLKSERLTMHPQCLEASHWFWTILACELSLMFYWQILEELVLYFSRWRISHSRLTCSPITLHQSIWIGRCTFGTWRGLLITRAAGTRRGQSR